MTTRSRAPILAGVLAGLMALAGCHGGGDAEAGSPSGGASTGAAAPAAPVAKGGPSGGTPAAQEAPAKAPPAPPKAAASAAPAKDAGTAPAAPTKGAPSRADLEHLLARLKHHVRVWAFKDPKNPWALCHGILALGPKVRLEDGRLAIDAILSQATVKTLDGKTFPVFEGNAPDGTPREPHANLVVRSLLDSGVSPKHRFRAGGKTWTVADLYRGALWSFDQPPAGHFGPWAWTLMAMSRAVHDGISGTTFVDHAGKRFDMRKLVREATENLADEMAFMKTDEETGAPLVKRRQGIYAEACGGMHFVEAPATWLFDAQSDHALAAPLQDIEHILEWRLTAETALYRKAWSEAPPQYLRLLAVQDQKFYGHWLEATFYLHRGGIQVKPAKVEEAEADLQDAIRRLDQFHAFDQMPEIDRERHQSYLDLIGDAAHAVYGLSHWLDAGIPPKKK